MHRKLPKEIDPWRMAQNGIQLSGEISLDTMPRLCESLLTDQGIVQVELAFEMDEVGTPYMKGQFQTEVSLTCERCLSEMRYALSTKCLLAMVMSESKIDELAEQYDPWLLENNDPVALASVIEDELILGLPLVPRHQEACLPAEVWTSGEDETEEVDKPASPFAVLSSLKKK